MSRKNPSSHSDEQFALFVEYAGDDLEAADHGQFKELVSRLIRIDARTPETLVAASAIVASGSAKKPGFNGTHNGPALEVAAHATPMNGRRNGEREGLGGPPQLLPLIGQFAVQWSSSQRLLIRLLALMLETDETSAAVVFAALGITHLRIDLFRRLASIKIGDGQTRQELCKIVDDFENAGHVRNEVVHSMHPVNDRGEADPRHVRNVMAARDNLRLLSTALENVIPRVEKAIETYRPDVAG